MYKTKLATMALEHARFGKAIELLCKVCWCETNDKEKTKAISDEEQAIVDLGNAVNANTAKAATLNAEIGALNKGIGENSKSLAQAMVWVVDGLHISS